MKRVALVQFRPEMGQVNANLSRLAETAKQCVAEGADTIVFPECATAGYVIEDGATECALSLDEVSAAFSGIEATIICGFHEKADGKPFNSAAILRTGHEPQSYRKMFLPTYGVFDEARYVQPGQDLGRFGDLGVAICEDIWHSIVPTMLAVSGAELIVCPVASPARGFADSEPGNVKRYARMLRSVAEEHGIYACTSCLVGFEGGKGLSGATMAFDPTGSKLDAADILDEGIITFDIDQEIIASARSRSPLIRDVRARWGDLMRMGRELG